MKAECIGCEHRTAGLFPDTFYCTYADQAFLLTNNTVEPDQCKFNPPYQHPDYIAMCGKCEYFNKDLKWCNNPFFESEDAPEPFNPICFKHCVSDESLPPVVRSLMQTAIDMQSQHNALKSRLLKELKDNEYNIIKDS